MDSPIDWDLAARVAARTAGTEPLADSYHYNSLEGDFAVATTKAIDLVTSFTGLSISHEDVGQVVTREPWVKANLRATKRVLEPVAMRVMERSQSKTTSSVGSRVTAIELGALLGWMSRRVLGQYDVFEGDVIYYVGPNILAIEKKYGFSPGEFRLWVAMHEVTHRAQFRGIDWMQPYFLGLVDQLVALFDPDPKRFFSGLRQAANAAREKTAGPREMGLIGAFTTPEQQIIVEKLQALMSVLEGHADVVMNGAGGEFVPSASRFHHVFHERRMSASGFGGALQRLFGFEAKMRQYARGSEFIKTIQETHGDSAVGALWKSSENLPTYSELEKPEFWARRVLGVDSNF